MRLRFVRPFIGLTASLGGCASTAPTYVEPTAQAILVEQEKTVLLLQTLGVPERQRLRYFIASTSRGRYDALHLDIVGSRRLGEQIAAEARAVGVDTHNIRLYGPFVDRRDGSAARIEAITYEAHPPVCPSIAIVGPSVNDNSFDPTLGCSIHNNLAGMVNDPRDLIDNQAVVPSDGNRAAIPVATYKTFAAGNNSNSGVANNKLLSDPTSAGTQTVQPPR